MKVLIVIIGLVGNLKVTSYQSLVKDTDSTPFHTSTGERVHGYGVAVSRDLLCGACRKLRKRCQHPENPTKLHYGDMLYIEDVGVKFVNDVMGATSWNKATKKRVPIKQQLDVWVPSQKAEKTFHAQFGKRKLQVWKIKGEEHEQEK